MEKSVSIQNIAIALAAVQAELKGAKKTQDNPYFNSTYADLGEVWETCRELLSKNGLSVLQLPCMQGDKQALTTLVMHVSGEWIQSTVVLNPVKSDPQSAGAAVTYWRRFSLAAAIGIHQEDDDGNVASGRDSKPQAPVKNTPKQVQPQEIEVTEQNAVEIFDPHYTIDIGKKYVGKKMSTLNPDDAKSFAQYLIDAAEKSGKPLDAKASKFVTQARAYYLLSFPQDV